MHKPEKNGQEHNTILPQTGLTSLLFSEFNSIKPPILVLMSGNWLQITFNLLKSTNPKNLQSTYQFCWLNIKMPINTELQEANATKIIDKKNMYHYFIPLSASLWNGNLYKTEIQSMH